LTGRLSASHAVGEGKWPPQRWPGMLARRRDRHRSGKAFALSDDIKDKEGLNHSIKKNAWKGWHSSPTKYVQIYRQAARGLARWVEFVGLAPPPRMSEAKSRSIQHRHCRTPSITVSVCKPPPPTSAPRRPKRWGRGLRKACEGRLVWALTVDQSRGGSKVGKRTGRETNKERETKITKQN